MKVSKNAKELIATAVILVLVVFGFAFISRTLSGSNLPIAAVQSGSMEPTIPVGSLLFIQKVPRADIAAGDPPTGDVVIYIFPNEVVTDYFLFAVYDPLPWSHRAIESAQINGTYYFLTKGDANRFPDQNPNMPSTWVPEDRIIGKVTYFIPYLGYPFLWFKNVGVVTLVLVVLIVLVLIPIGGDKKKKESEVNSAQAQKPPESDR